MTEKIRIVLADDHPIVLDGLRNLIRAEPDFELVGEVRKRAQRAEDHSRAAP